MSFRNIAAEKTNQLSTEVNSFKTIWFTKVRPNLENLEDPKIRNTVKISMKQLIRLSGIIEQKIDKGKDGGHDEDIHRVYDGPYYEFSQKRENILQQIQTIDDRERAQKAAEEAKVLQQTEGNADQIQVQQEQEDLDFIQEQTEQIVTDMQDLKEITQQVHDKIQSDHQVVVRIDEKIEEAKVDMVEGNKELEKAEQDQKKCNIY